MNSLWNEWLSLIFDQFFSSLLVLFSQFFCQSVLPFFCSFASFFVDFALRLSSTSIKMIWVDSDRRCERGWIFDDYFFLEFSKFSRNFCWCLSRKIFPTNIDEVRVRQFEIRKYVNWVHIWHSVFCIRLTSIFSWQWHQQKINICVREANIYYIIEFDFQYSIHNSEEKFRVEFIESNDFSIPISCIQWSRQQRRVLSIFI